MLNEVVSVARPSISKNILDVTFGRGGHTKAFLQRGATVYACDRDIDAYYAGMNLACNNSRFNIFHTKFSEIERKIHTSHSFDVIVMDLGLCSTQIIHAERGFSFYNDGMLDMRMGFASISAFDIINYYSHHDLSNLLKFYGEEKMHNKIAKRIVERRKSKLFYTTKDLSSEISCCVRRTKRHPATKSFQAIRIHVNNELNEIEFLLTSVYRMLKPGGILISIAFHSLEDRILKSFFKSMKSHAKALPQKREIRCNKSARSAIMRFGCV